MKRAISGFTIVELLIVIVVISILASLTVTAYSQVQNRSYESIVRSDLRMISKKLAVTKVDSANDRYPQGYSVNLDAIDIKITPSAYSTVANNNLTYYETDDGVDYAVLATVRNGPVLYIKGSDPTIRTYTGPSNGGPQYPGGMAENHITSMGFNTANFEAYAAYVGSSGGWRIWN